MHDGLQEDEMGLRRLLVSPWLPKDLLLLGVLPAFSLRDMGTGLLPPHPTPSPPPHFHLEEKQGRREQGEEIKTSFI